MTTPPAPLQASLPSSAAELQGALEGYLRERLGPLDRLPPWLRRSLPPLSARLLGSVLRRPRSPSGPFYLPTDPGEIFPTASWTTLLPPPPVPLPREEAAAALAFAVLRIRQRVADGSWAQDMDNGDPLEHSVYANFFSRALVPDAPHRFLLRDSESRFIVALVQGRAFRVELHRQGASLSRAALAGALRRCVELAPQTPPAPTLLSAAPCGFLADAYRRLCTDQRNLSSLRTLSEAVFVICLDDGNPTSDEETAFLLHAGNPENRWYLHGLQLVAFPSGITGVVGSFETGLEGQPAIRVVGELAAAMTSAQPPTPLAGPLPRVTPLLWRVDPRDLAPARASCDARFRRAPEHILRLGFRREDASALRIPVNCAFHLILQAALIDELGDLPRGEILQQVSLRHIEGKRLALQPVVTPETRAFGLALRAGAAPAVLLRAAQDAGNTYRELVDDAKKDCTHESLLREAISLVPPRLQGPLGHALGAIPQPPELFRLSLLPKPPTIPLLGRFGVHSRVPTSIWAHPLFTPEGTIMVCAPGREAVVNLERLSHHFERVLLRLRENLASPPG
jgi:hypothetical protein